MERTYQTNVQRPMYMPIVSRTEIAPVQHSQVIVEQKPVNNLPFIEANTKEVEMEHLTEDCIIPVFSKDNEVTISHQSFIETVFDAVREVFPRESISDPAIRVSHVVKGRFTDEEIYSMAVHYYVEENIDPGKPLDCRVVVNHQVQLTEDEIAEQKRLAKEKLLSQETNRLRSSGRPSARKPIVDDTSDLLFAFE